MKTISGNLYELIKSLTAAEKSHFKRYIKYESSSKHSTVKLFNAIERQSLSGNGYDEDRLKKQLKNEKFIRHLSITKNQLYNAILRSLNLYYARKREHFKVGELLNLVRVLNEKGLFRQSVSLVDKAKDIAKKYEMFTQ